MYMDLRKETMMGMKGKEFQEMELDRLLGKGSKQDIERTIMYIKIALALRRRILEMRD